MPQYAPSIKPVNRILQSPPDVEILEMEVGANATAAKMLPGRLVIDDTTDGDVKEAGANADNVIGVIEVQSGMLLADNYAVGDPISIIPRHSGARVLLTLVSGSGAVSPGDPLVSAADGKAALQAVGAMGAQGTVIAHALASEDPSAADKTVVAVLSSAAEPAAAA